jgi:hypothetical protein
MTPEAFAGYCKGNVIKYVWRYEKKDQLEGLLKAQWYLNRLIQKVEEPSMVSLEDVEIEEMASSSISQHL